MQSMLTEFGTSYFMDKLPDLPKFIGTLISLPKKVKVDQGIIQCGRGRRRLEGLEPIHEGSTAKWVP